MNIFSLRPIDVVNLQAAGAYPAGTVIAKQNSERGDGHKDGDLGIVRASITEPAPTGELRTMYFVEWDDMPGVVVGTLEYKVSKTSPQ